MLMTAHDYRLDATIEAANIIDDAVTHYEEACQHAGVDPLEAIGEYDADAGRVTLYIPGEEGGEGIVSYGVTITHDGPRFEVA